MILVWPWILIDRESSWSWILRTIYIQCQSKLVVVPPHKPPNLTMDVYDSNNSGLKTMVDIWTIMYMFTEEYRIFDQKFHLTMWFFRFITWITLTCDYVLWRIVSLMAWNHPWIKLVIYRVTPDPFKWYFKGFIFMWPE